MGDYEKDLKFLLENGWECDPFSDTISYSDGETFVTTNDIPKAAKIFRIKLQLKSKNTLTKNKNRLRLGLIRKI